MGQVILNFPAIVKRAEVIVINNPGSEVLVVIRKGYETVTDYEEVLRVHGGRRIEQLRMDSTL